MPLLLPACLPAWLQPQPAQLPNPLPLATRQYVALALHTAVHNTRWGPRTSLYVHTTLETKAPRNI